MPAVIHRDDLILQQFIQGLAVFPVAPTIVVIFRRRLDRPAIGAVVALVPPAVGNRQVEHAVHRRLHAGGAGGFQRIDRVVQPDIAAGNQPAREAEVIAFHHQQLALELGPARDFVDAADQLLAGLVGRVRLAGENEQHRPVGIVDDLAHPVHVFEHQRGALVGREAAREADGQHVGIEWIGVLEHALQVRLGTMIAQVLLGNAMVQAVQHLGFQGLMHGPEMVIRDGIHLAPELDVGQPPAPFVTELVVEQILPFLGQEGGNMDAVGDVAHRRIFRRQLRPHVGKNVRRNLAVDARDAVVVA